jgi:hypothetical protein
MAGEPRQYNLPGSGTCGYVDSTRPVGGGGSTPRRRAFPERLGRSADVGGAGRVHAVERVRLDLRRYRSPMTAAGAWQALAGQADIPALRMPLGITNSGCGSELRCHHPAEPAPAIHRAGSAVSVFRVV